MTKKSLDKVWSTTLDNIQARFPLTILCIGSSTNRTVTSGDWLIMFSHFKYNCTEQKLTQTPYSECEIEISSKFFSSAIEKFQSVVLKHTENWYE